MLRLAGVTYRYPGAAHASLHGVHLDLPAGQVTGLAGPAEAGKTTLCLVAGGLAPRVAGGTLGGEISLDGWDVRAWPMHRLIEQVVTGLQDPAGQLSLIAERVLDEVAFGPANLGLARDEVVARAEEALSALGIETLAHRDPRTLSGGQQQLVVLAGLFAMRPRYLVLDEPLAHLDAAGERLVLSALRRLADAGTGVLLVEQRVTALIEACDSVAIIARGNILARGPAVETLSDPTVAALGVDELPEARLRRQLLEAGLDPALLEAPA